MRPPGLAAAVRPAAGLPRPSASETDRQGTGHGDRKCGLTLADHPRRGKRPPVATGGGTNHPSCGVVRSTPLPTRQLEQCEPDRTPRPGPQTRTVDHGDRRNGERGTHVPSPGAVDVRPYSRPGFGHDDYFSALQGRVEPISLTPRYDVVHSLPFATAFQRTSAFEAALAWARSPRGVCSLVGIEEARARAPR